MGDCIDAMRPAVRFDAELIRRYDGHGPRYTSYPTALQFSADVDAIAYRQNAVDSNCAALPLSLCIHIPFCKSLCYYCGCNKVVTRNAERVNRYLSSLHREIELQSALFSEHRQVEQLHFGGGTPTYLDPEQMSGLLMALDNGFGLDMSDQHEYSIEVDPRTVDDGRLAELAALGFNRLSLGVQDFDRRVQNAVNRVQSVQQVSMLTDTARALGFRSISFDLIYGLPLQTEASFEATLDRVVDIRPDRLSVYNYAHLPGRFKGQRMIRVDQLPAAGVKLDILARTIDRLTGAGYIYVGMDHFALPDDDLVRARGNGSLHRNFQGYSTHRQTDLVGLGASAIGRVGDMYAQNVTTTTEYEKSLREDRLPVVRGLVLDDDDRLRAAAIQALMCYDRLDYAGFLASHDVDAREYFAPELAALEGMQRDGLVEIDESGISVTTIGRLLVRNIAMTFDRYLDTDDMRFSRAI